MGTRIKGFRQRSKVRVFGKPRKSVVLWKSRYKRWRFSSTRFISYLRAIPWLVFGLRAVYGNSVQFGLISMDCVDVVSVGHENGMPWITIVRKQNTTMERIVDSRNWFGIHYA